MILDMEKSKPTWKDYTGPLLTVGHQGLFLLLWQCLDKGSLSAGVLLGACRRAETDRATIIQLATPSSAHSDCGEDWLNQIKVILFQSWLQVDHFSVSSSSPPSNHRHTTRMCPTPPQPCLSLLTDSPTHPDSPVPPPLTSPETSA